MSSAKVSRRIGQRKRFAADSHGDGAPVPLDGAVNEEQQSAPVAGTPADCDMFDMQQMFNVDHPVMQRMVVFFLFAEGCSAAEITRRLKVVFGECSLSRPTTARWSRAFAQGTRSLLDKPRSGRPKIAEKDSGVQERFDRYVDSQPGVIPSARQCMRAIATSKHHARKLLYERFGDAYTEQHRTAKTGAVGGGGARQSASTSSAQAAPKRAKASRASAAAPQCDLCKVAFADRAALKQHVIRVHIGMDNMPLEAGGRSGTAPFGCEPCESGNCRSGTKSECSGGT